MQWKEVKLDPLKAINTESYINYSIDTGLIDYSCIYPKSIQ